MNILDALRKEESKFLKQLDAAKQQLETIRSAIILLGGKKGKTTGRKRRKMSAATRKKMAAAAKARWAKVAKKE